MKAYDLISFVVLFGTGILFVWLGILIWKKQKISLIHSYHYAKVKEEDKKAYTSTMGKSTALIGMGCILSGILNSEYSWIPFAGCFILALVFIYIAQRKYNGGLF